MNKVAFGLMVCLIMMVQAFSLFFPDGMEKAGGIGDPTRAITLSNGGVTPKSGDPVNDTFVFYVTYDDGGDWPYYLMVYIDGVAHYNFNYTQVGSKYNCTYRDHDFDSGEHQFYFMADNYYNGSSANRYPSSGNLSFTVDPGYHRPQLFNSTISNTEPETGEVLDFSVWYKDPDGNPPLITRLVIEGYTYITMERIGSDYQKGVIFKCNWTVPYKNQYRYYFLTNDSTRLSGKSEEFQFHVLDHPCELYDPCLNPTSGDARYTTFRFSIWCKDIDGEWKYPMLSIVGDYDGYGIYNDTFWMDPRGGNDPKTGLNCSVWLELYSGEYEYYFYVRNDYYYPNGSYNETEARYPETGFLTMTAGGAYNPPELYNASVSPLTGNVSTVYTFRVWYRDPNGDEPSYINIDLNEGPPMNGTMKIIGTDYKKGVMAEWKTKFAKPGLFHASFYAVDPTDLRASTWTNSTIKVFGKPGLSYLNNATTSPRVPQFYNCMDFFVEYHDSLNQLPLEGWVVIDDSWNSSLDVQYYGGENISSVLMRSHWHPHHKGNGSASTFKYHFEVIDSQCYEIRYPSSGELTLEAFERLPNLFNGQVSPSNGSDLQEYEFSVTYWDWLNVKPASIQLILDEDVYQMEITKPKNASGNNSEDPYYLGKKKMMLTPGEHFYYFKGVSAEGPYNYHPYDARDLRRIFVEGHSELSGAGHSPSRIFTDTVVNFTVTFKDTSGLAPDYVQVFIDNDVHEMGAGSTDYKNGVQYYFETTLSAGNHSYFFLIENKHGMVRSPQKGHYHKLTVLVPHAPVLLEAGISPKEGDTTTQFEFKCKYRDQDGDAPEMVLISLDGIAHDMIAENSTDYVKGVVYTFKTNLTQGRHVYCFEARDITGRSAKAPATDTFSIDVLSSEKFPPIAKLGLTYYGMKVTFSGAGSTDVDGTIESYLWVIEGKSYTGKQVTVEFSHTGYYKAALTVMDDDGMSDEDSLGFWVFESGDAPSSSTVDVGASVYIDDSGKGNVLINESGFAVSIVDVDDDSISIHIESDSSDPRVVVFEISKDALEFSEDGTVVLTIDGKQVKMATSLEQVLTANGTDPLFWLIETDGTYKVMLYLPDPSDVDLEISRSEGAKAGMVDGLIIILTIVVLVIFLILIAVFAFLRSRSKGRKGINNSGIADEEARSSGKSIWNDGLDENLEPIVGKVLEGGMDLPRRLDLGVMEKGLKKRRDRGNLSEREYGRYRNALDRMKEE